MSDERSPWAVRHADTIFKVLLVALAALWLLVPVRREPAPPRAEAAQVDVATRS
ncbi:hypothetical protein [Phreatobacter sp.]|uniref:hypothetical protein n=1 Tax=Phreatobacter sp. TaxID=1966341 RepID=UPI0025E1574E|nr:hypothetical protein [Phreatobacter sp.]